MDCVQNHASDFTPDVVDQSTLEKPMYSTWFGREGWQKLAELTIKWFPPARDSPLLVGALHEQGHHSIIVPSVANQLLNTYIKATKSLAPKITDLQQDTLRQALEPSIKENLLDRLRNWTPDDKMSFPPGLTDADAVIRRVNASLNDIVSDSSSSESSSESEDSHKWKRGETVADPRDLG